MIFTYSRAKRRNVAARYVWIDDGENIGQVFLHKPDRWRTSEHLKRFEGWHPSDILFFARRKGWLAEIGWPDDV